MPAKIKHVALVSRDYALLGIFYEALFGMQSSRNARRESAVAISDGYVGMNINPRAPGRQAGFDHFGFEVDDVERIQKRVREQYPTVELLKRPSNRPFAGISMHDPAGNVFDLSQRGMENRTDVYEDVEQTGSRNPRHIRHFMLRAVDPTGLAQFYRDLFELKDEDKPADDPNCYLTDGQVTLIIAPWKIADYLGSGIERPALEHLGFAVESLEQFEADLKRVVSRNSYLAPRPVGAGPEGEVRLKLLATCRYGRYQLADPDGVLIDVSENAVA